MPPQSPPTHTHNPLKQKIDWYTEETAAQGRGLADMLSNPNIRAVIIALPIPVQADYIKQALQAGKHVLSEKPIAADLEGAQRLVTWYRTECAGGVTWGVAENYRFVEGHAHAAREVGKLGRVMGFRVKVNRFMAPDNKYVRESLNPSAQFHWMLAECQLTKQKHHGVRPQPSLAASSSTRECTS